MSGSHTTVRAVLNPPRGGRGGYARLVIALLRETDHRDRWIGANENERPGRCPPPPRRAVARGPLCLAPAGRAWVMRVHHVCMQAGSRRAAGIRPLQTAAICRCQKRLATTTPNGGEKTAPKNKGKFSPLSSSVFWPNFRRFRVSKKRGYPHWNRCAA